MNLDTDNDNSKTKNINYTKLLLFKSSKYLHQDFGFRILRKLIPWKFAIYFVISSSRVFLSFRVAGDDVKKRMANRFTFVSLEQRSVALAAKKSIKTKFLNNDV